MTESLRQAVIECLRENGITRDSFRKGMKPIYLDFPAGHEFDNVYITLLCNGFEPEGAIWVKTRMGDKDFDELMKEVENND